jgi:predicted amidohydrolase
MVKKMFEILDQTMVYQPDIVCLPEVFATSNVSRKYSMDDNVKLSAEALEQFFEFSNIHNCYTVCPVYTSENGKIYNSAVFIDRRGKRMGEYRKIYLTEGEIENGLTPGPLRPPVFKTDFGIVGAQICFDVLYDDGWRKLRDQGAEVVFWPSAFGGGKMINARCWQNNYLLVSSTRKNISKICDVTGEEIAATGYWNNNLFCAPVNLEKAVLRIWPAVNRFRDINEKYGRKVRITVADEEGWAVIESLSPDVFVKDILNEFGLKTWKQTVNEAEMAQIKSRNTSKL